MDYASIMMGSGADWQEEDLDGDYVPACTICGSDMEREECHQCHGDGGWDLYEDDPIENAPGDWRECPECGGKGVYWVCENSPHHEQVGGQE